MRSSSWGFKMERKARQQHFRWDGAHWWTRSTRWLCSRVLDGIACVRGGHLKIWDAGCGTGKMAAEAMRYGEVVATDCDEETVALAREQEPRVEFRCGAIGSEGFGNCFDVVLSLDVLYHRSVEDWRSVFRVLVGALVPGGVLIMQVPAYDWLAGRHDDFVGGGRRFFPREVLGAAREAGLRIRRFSHRFALLVPLVWLRRTYWNWGVEVGDLEVSAGGDLVCFLMERALRWEAKLILRGFSFEVGSSLFLVAERGGE